MADPLVPDVYRADNQVDTETPSDTDGEDRVPVVDVKPEGIYFVGLIKGVNYNGSRELG